MREMASQAQIFLLMSLCRYPSPVEYFHSVNDGVGRESRMEEILGPSSIFQQAVLVGSASQ